MPHHHQYVALFAVLLLSCSVASGEDELLVLRGDQAVSIKLSWHRAMTSAMRFRVQVEGAINEVGAVAVGVSSSSSFFGIGGLSDLAVILPHHNINNSIDKVSVEDANFKKMKIRTDTTSNDLEDIQVIANTIDLLVVEFTKPIKATDTNEDVTLTLDTPQSILWAYWERDCDDNQWSYKGKRPTDMSVHPQPINWLLSPNNKRDTAEETATTLTSTSSSSSNESDCGLGKGSYQTENGLFLLEWAISANGTMIDFVMTGRTHGWVSFGISTAFLMERADKYTGWVDSDGTVQIYDTWSPSRSTPKLDTDMGGTNDVLNPAGFENDTHTVLMFSRLLDTGDSTADRVIANRGIWLLWAVADEDGRSGSHYAEHGGANGLDFGGVPGFNFFSCGRVYAPEGTSIFLQNAAQGLLLTVAIALLVIAVVYWVRRLFGKVVPHDPLPSDSIDKSTIKMHGSQIEMLPQSPDAVDVIELDSSQQRPSSSIQQQSPQQPQQLQSHVTQAVNLMEGVFEWRVKGLLQLPTVMFGVVYLAINVAWAAYWMAAWPEGGVIFSLSERVARVFGHLVSGNMVLAILPATRNSILVWLTGQSFERTIVFHKFIGRFTLWLLIAHTVAFSVARGAEVFVREGKVITSQVFAWIGLLCLIIVVLTSVGFMRRRVFNVFYFMHFFFLPFYLLAALHNYKVIMYIVIAAVLYGLDRLLRLVWGTVPFKCVEVAPLAGGVTRLRWRKHPLAIYHPGQYVFVNFPQVNLLEWHPFSLANGTHELTCEIDIKSLGNYTSKLNTVVESVFSQGRTLWIRCDGPYGRLSVDVLSCPVVVLLSTGIGVTPMLSIARTVFRVGDLGSDSPSPVVESKCLGTKCLVQHVYFNWGVKNREQYAWFGDVLSKCSAASNSGGSTAVQFHLDVRMSSLETEQQQHQEEQENNKWKAGHLDAARIIEEVVASHSISGVKIGVCVCGPKQLMSAALDSVLKHKRKGVNIDIHHETFSL